ncbi:MAG: hypothetical protein R3C13_02840 [Hyphomonas sp.]|uniref:hypothetical protein n=1 Tax=Hyphomonas sp. TaxID=87 RepID=UPI00352833D4
MTNVQALGMPAALAAAALLVACQSAPAASCAGSFCDGFEDADAGTVPDGPWQVGLANATLVVDDTRAASGDKSIRIDLAGKGTGFLIGPAARTGRMKVFLEAAPEGDVHWTLIELSGPRPSDGRIAELRIGGQHPVANGSRLMANYETPEGYTDETAPLSDCWHHAEETDVMPTGRWTEFAWAAGADGKTLEVSIDGVPIPALTVEGHGQGCLHQPADYAWELPDVTETHLGWESYQPDGPRHLWIDDVVLGEGD